MVKIKQIIKVIRKSRLEIGQGKKNRQSNIIKEYSKHHEKLWKAFVSTYEILPIN